jgi:hypothetical protein
MAAKNDVTGDAIKSRVITKAYEEGYERIFGKKREENKELLNKIDNEKCMNKSR